jgi:hypothetical protein
MSEHLTAYPFVAVPRPENMARQKRCPAFVRSEVIPETGGDRGW